MIQVGSLEPTASPRKAPRLSSIEANMKGGQFLMMYESNSIIDPVKRKQFELDSKKRKDHFLNNQ
jgi:hypothetical protein